MALTTKMITGSAIVMAVLFAFLLISPFSASKESADTDSEPAAAQGKIASDASKMIKEGRRTFRFATFGDEAFWGDSLRLHEAIKGLSPTAALELGLKVDVKALPPVLIDKLRKGQVDLNDPTVTLELLKLNAVVGVIGFFNEQGDLQSAGITCAICHSLHRGRFACAWYRSSAGRVG